MNKIKNLIFRIIYFSGLVKVFRYFQRNRITILIYHDPDPKDFELHLRYLKKNYSLISMEEALEIFKSRNKILPKRSTVITFDDGHKGNYKLLPLFRKYRLTPTIFLAFNYIGTNIPFWFKHKEVIKDVNLKKIENRKRLALMEESDFNFNIQKKREALSMKEIIEMQPYVDFQSHTLSHPILTMCTNETSYEEINSSKQKLQNLLGKEIVGIAYPNGDYSQREVKYCREAGYHYALTINQGLNTMREEMFELKRIGTNDTGSLTEFAIRVSGLWSLVLRIVG